MKDILAHNKSQRFKVTCFLYNNYSRIVLTKRMDNKKIAIFGVGRVGLPLALILADKGFQVTGIDVDLFRINLLKNKL